MEDNECVMMAEVRGNGRLDSRMHGCSRSLILRSAVGITLQYISKHLDK
jgi:hypothetical protein